MNGPVPLAAVSTGTYDAFGRLATETDPAGLARRFAYDAADNLVAITYPPVAGSGRLDPTTELTLRSPFNAALVVAQMDRAGSTVRYAYDRALRLATLINSLSGLTTRTYDALGRVATETAPPPTGSTVPGLTTTAYDLFDRPLTITHPDHVPGSRERIEVFAYDSRGKLLRKAGAGEPGEVSRHDPGGHRPRAHAPELGSPEVAAGSQASRARDARSDPRLHRGPRPRVSAGLRCGSGFTPRRLREPDKFAP